MLPNLFNKEKIIEIYNPELLAAIDEVKDSSNREEALQKAYSIITKKYSGHRFLTYILFWKSFEGDPNKLWERHGFMHCHQQNFLLRVLLVRSNWFEEEDLGLGFSLVWYISFHQYLKIKMRKLVAVDPWNSSFGLKIGEYATGFGSKKL